MSDVVSIATWLEAISSLTIVPALVAKVTIVLVVAWCLQILVRAANPRWQVILWRFTFVALLTLPIAHLCGPSFAFRPRLRTIVIDLDIVTMRPTKRFDGTVTADQSERSEQSEDSFAHLPFNTASQPTAWSIDPLRLAVVVWCFGTVALLLRTIAGAMGIQRLLQTSRPASPRMQASFLDVARSLRVSEQVGLRVSGQITSPVLAGLWRPTLVMPESMDVAPDAFDATDSGCQRTGELRPGQDGVFAHELAHVLGNDLRWNLLGHATSCLLWFHPCAWGIRHQHAMACESLCDAIAVAHVGDEKLYARTLAQVAINAFNVPPLSLSMAHHDVARRIKELRKNACHTALPVPSILSYLALAAVFAFAVGSFKPIAAQLPATPVQSTPPAFPVVPAGAAATDAQRDQTSSETGALAAATNPGAETTPPTGREGNVGADRPASELVTPKTNSATLSALQFLAKRQQPDGSFGAGAPPVHRPAVTALCGMAFLADGSIPGKGLFGKELNMAVAYLVDHVQPNGIIASKPNSGMMYAHAYAVRFLAQAHMARPSPEVESALRQAVMLIVKSQNKQDGWRYTPESRDADSSVTACQVLALQAARRAGTKVPQETLDRAIGYLRRNQQQDGGFSYVERRKQSAIPRSAAIMTAILQSDDAQAPRNDRTLAGIGYLKSNAQPEQTDAPFYYFSQYHLSGALKLAGDNAFVPWYTAARDKLLATQRDDGSWHSTQNDSEYNTAKACLVLLAGRKR